jgi:AcrR family transcriptional regulator
MRADAARNRHAILEAGRQIYTQQGLDAPMDAVAKAAGVGIGTVYRHFPDRSALVRAVVADRIELVLGLVAVAATEIEGPEPAAAWARFFDGLLESRMPLLMPVLVPHARDADVFTSELAALRLRVMRAAVALVTRAQTLGLVREDVGAPEIMLTFAAAMRPIPGLPTELNEALLERRGPLLLAALRPGGEPLPGTRIDLDDLLPVITAPVDPQDATRPDP